MDTWDAKKVQDLIHESFKLTAHQKTRQAKGERVQAVSVCLVVDDMADQQSILHATGNSILNSAFIRARHAYLSVWVASQRPNHVSNIIRTQMSALITVRQRIRRDFEGLVDILGHGGQEDADCHVRHRYQGQTQLPLYQFTGRRCEQHVFFFCFGGEC